MATLLPEGKQSFTDGAGVPLVGGKLYTYDAGTSTPRPTYADAAGTVPNPNPVVLDARGEATVFWQGAYKAVLKDKNNVTIWTIDGVADAGSALALDLLDTAPGKGAALVGFKQSGSGAASRTAQDKLREFVSVMDFGAVGDGVADDTAAIQAALVSGATEVYLPAGLYGVKSTGAALTLSGSGIKFHGPGALAPLANASGWAPQQMLVVSGNRNTISVNIHNPADLGKRASDASNEYPMDGIRVTGTDNAVEGCEVLNFVTPIVIRGGTGNKVIRNRVLVKQVSNLAWPNDGILWFQASRGECAGNLIGLAASGAQRTVELSGVSGASTSTLRTGITLDDNTAHIVVSGNHIGEGFVAGIHLEGATGDRNHIVTGNVIYKQRRNAINAAGQRVTITENICLGTFNTDATVNLTGIIGSVDGRAIISGNRIVCDQPGVEGVRLLANAADVQVTDNQFDGSFLHCVRGVANNVRVAGNTLRGTALRFASLDKPAAVTGDVGAVVEGNYANGITGKFAFLDSGLAGSVSRNRICMAEGYTAADGVIEFGGGYSGTPASAKVQVIGNDCTYVGSTAITGTNAFVKSSASGGSNLRVTIRDNSFDTSIWSSVAAGSFLTGARTQVSGNSSNASSGVNQRTGTFTLAAAATTNVANNSVSIGSHISLTPLNAAAATLMRTKQLYVSGRVAETRFDVTTGDGTAAAGTEQFSYTIED